MKTTVNNVDKRVEVNFEYHELIAIDWMRSKLDTMATMTKNKSDATALRQTIHFFDKMVVSLELADQGDVNKSIIESSPTECVLDLFGFVVNSSSDLSDKN